MKLLIKEIVDQYVRENFQKLGNFLSGQAILKGQWQFITISESTAVINKPYQHGLKFIPKDVLVTSVIGGSLTFNYARFDEKYIYITTDGPVEGRSFVGLYAERGE